MTDLRPTSAQDDLRATLADAGRVDPEVERLRAESERLRAALVECQEEIDDYIRAEYPLDHPTHDRCRSRDFSVNPARIALEAQTND